jgi:uncharacterized repeat protein (TIGR01451 family)
MLWGDHSTFKLLGAAALTANLVVALLQPARAQEEEEVGIVTIQAAAPKTPTVGWPLTFTISVNNDSVSQRVGLEDFLPSGASLVSATPSQGTCDTHDRSARGRDLVGCSFGVVRSGSTAKVEIVVTPTVPGEMTNKAVATAELSAPTPTNSSSATVTVGPVPGSVT